MHQIDTLIIGGGVAGASLACGLAERGAGERAAQRALVEDCSVATDALTRPMLTV